MNYFPTVNLLKVGVNQLWEGQVRVPRHSGNVDGACSDHLKVMAHTKIG